MTSHWESRNGYTPPPRFQQLRARDQQQQQYQQQHQQQLQRQQAQQLQPAAGADNSPPSQDMPHARSPSFFSFRANRQQTDRQTSAPLSPTPQYSPPATNAPAQSPSGLPPPVPYTAAPQQQQQPHYITQATPPISQAPPPANQLPPQVPPPQQQQQPAQMPPPPPQNQRPSIPRQQSTSQQTISTSTSTTAVSVQPAPAPQMPQHTKGASQSQSQGQSSAPPLHPEIRSVVQLTIAHAHKIYFSGPLVRRLERQADGQKPHKDDGWTEIWAQLGGTTLSIWDMKEIQEASKQGREVPPSYINVTDAFVQVLGSVTVPATPTVPAKRYTNVLTLNTAGSNLLLFSCPSTQALLAWAASLRLAAWEKSRLEEIYTAHLIRITLSARDVPTTLVQGKTEGWARVRIAGQTDWKRLFVVVQEGTDSPGAAEFGAAAAGGGAGASAGPNTIKKKRMSNLFSRDHNALAPLPPKPLITMYTSPKPKDRKKALLTLHGVSQAFGVYPERPELISKSTLIKVEGTFGDEELAAALRTREGWLLLMPELDEGAGAGAGQGQAAEMLKWVLALHDAFELYGRPQAWTWDPRDPVSLMFGYPVGPQKENLFLDREIVESMDPRNDRTSAIRTEMKKLMLQHMRPAVQAVPQRTGNQPAGYESPPALPPMSLANNAPLPAPPGPPNQIPTQSPGQSSPPPTQTSGFQLPPLSFNTNSNLSPQLNANMPARDRPLTPITEQSSIGTMGHQRSMSKDVPSTLAASPSVQSTLVASSSSQSRLSEQPPAPASPASLRGGAPEPLAAAAMFAAGPFSASPTPITPNSLAPASAGPNATSFALGPPGPADLPVGNSRMPGLNAGAVAGAMYTTTSAPSPQGSSTNVTTHANSSPSTTPSITTTAIARSFPQVPSPPPSGGGGSGNVSPHPVPVSPPPAMSTTASTMTAVSTGTRTSTIETRSPPPPVSRASVDIHTRTPPASAPTSPQAAFAAAPRAISPQMQTQTPPQMQVQAPPQMQGQGQMQGQTQARSPIVPSQEIAWQNAVQQRQQQTQGTRTRTQDSFAGPGGSSWDVLPPSQFGGREQGQAGVFNQQQQQQQQQQNFAPTLPLVPGRLPSPKREGVSNDLSKEAGALYYMTNSSPAPMLGPRPVPQSQHQQNMMMTDSSEDGVEEHEEDQDVDATQEDDDESEYSQLPYNRSASGSDSRAAHNGPISSSFDGSRMIATSSTSSSSMVQDMGPPLSSYAPMRTTSPSSFGPNPGPPASGSPGRSVLGRKPSGARAQLTAPRSFSNNGHGTESISSQTVTESDEPSPDPIMATTTAHPAPQPHHRQQSTGSDMPFDDGEALAALTYLDIADEQEMAAASGSGSGAGAGSQAHGKDRAAEPARDRSVDDASVPAPGSGESGIQYRSSFAPSSKAAERKAKAQAQQAAQHAATHKPGRANGKRKSRVGGAWESSEEEEEEEDEEDDDDDDQEEEDSQRRMTRGSQSMSSSSQGGSHAPNPARPSLQQLRQPGSDYTQEMSPSHLRPPRNLPQIPGARGNDDYPIQPIPRRPVPDQQFSERRTYYEDGTPIRTQAEYPQPGAARQSMWSTVLDPGRQPGRAPVPESNNSNAKDTFVQLEPSETMTKAFTPQGLLSAGLADKEDRSARRQEELARENGASLINVPNKPPPPQTGLLGAITAHERERKRDGGVGAALTEREREKRVAEERQRRFDEQQRQQLEQMQQGGSMYGSQFGYNPMMNPMMMGMNPMMGMSPMMSGNGMMPGAGGLSPMMSGGNMGQMNPMMTGQMGQMGFPGMMGGFNPQHMFAAQQAAAAAYQQAMIAFSVAGSQVGGNDTAGGAGTPQGNPSANPVMGGMQGMGMGGMAGYDPRMSMMGMPMMGMGMGMGMGAPMGQQMTGQLNPGQMPLNMQMTGMSNFDPRSSPGISNGGGGGNGNDMGLQPPSQTQFSSRTSSPASRGSPLARGHQETADRGRSSTRPTSPSR